MSLYNFFLMVRFHHTRKSLDQHPQLASPHLSLFMSDDDNDHNVSAELLFPPFIGMIFHKGISSGPADPKKR